tara:strand:+ start:3913 stop:4092 length:180 start_codon:yes stop_codon:yes gene_type:complete
MTKSWLNNNNVSFTEKHVEDDGVAEELIGLGYKVTPVIIINGTAVVGYSPKKLEEALKI